ncbi:ATP-binding protein [uncultured Thiodictyon sp.]|uniref:ATP-binding protein n=1 Tax=uncultured Thiodictyon sp. TaxID=1846217 RepID=UPI0025E96E36|nr:ATP-binding protein [uncultured Thiodictyon sp.]
MPPPLKKLPVGIQTFSEIINEGYTYVDKTAHALALATTGKYWFLSRPRRFGKSLFLDTLKELFEGAEPLFRGLDCHSHWDWSRRHPVIRLDFAGGVVQSAERLDESIHELLVFNQRRLGIHCEATSIPGRFAELIIRAHEASGQRVVILVDEYDKPILDSIEHPQRTGALREGLKNLYSTMKAQDAHIQFVFMTGVTKFSKVSLFSGLNQLNDLTLDARFATLCGYTQADLETTFGRHLAGVDWAKLKRWYNGYNFLGEPVYNPFDILLFIDKGQLYRNYWFETGSPSFLIKLLQQRRTFLPELEGIEASEEILDSFDIEHIDPVTLLFQTGYLTIVDTRRRRSRLIYRLRQPNQEVKMALADHLIDGYLGTLPGERDARQDALYDCLSQGNVEGLISAIRRLFAGIPWRNFTGNTLPEAEGYYASVLYAFFASLNAEIIPEDISNQGQVDLTIKLADYIYVIEIKLRRSLAPPPDEPAPGDPTKTAAANPVLAQIRARGYSAKYRGLPSQGLFEVGLVFDSQAHNLVQADWCAVS